MRGLGGSKNTSGFWERVPIEDKQLFERAGATASVIGNHIYIIGGRNR